LSDKEFVAVVLEVVQWELKAPQRANGTQTHRLML
jgi:hypothetical protein